MNDINNMDVTQKRVMSFSKVEMIGLIASCLVNADRHTVRMEILNKQRHQDQSSMTVMLIAKNEELDTFLRIQNETRQGVKPHWYLKVVGHIKQRRNDIHKMETYIRASRFAVTPDAKKEKSKVEINGIVADVKQNYGGEDITVYLYTSEDKKAGTAMTSQNTIIIPVRIDRKAEPRLMNDFISGRIRKGAPLKIKGEIYASKITSNETKRYNQVKVVSQDSRYLGLETKKAMGEQIQRKTKRDRKP